MNKGNQDMKKAPQEHLQVDNAEESQMFMLLSNGPSKIPESEPIVGSRGRMEPRQLFSEVIHGLHSQVDPVSFRKDQLHKNHLIRRHNYKQMSSDVKLISFQPSHIKPNSSFTV